MFLLYSMKKRCGEFCPSAIRGKRVHMLMMYTSQSIYILRCPYRGKILKYISSDWETNISSVQSLSHVWFFVTPTDCSTARNYHPLSPKFAQIHVIELVMPSHHLVLCYPVLLLPSVFPSIRVFSNESVLYIRWPKYWSFRFSINPSNEYSCLIFFRIDWFNLLAVQETFKSLLQHHSSKESIHLHSAFFMVQLSHPYVTTGKNSFDYGPLSSRPRSASPSLQEVSTRLLSLSIRGQIEWKSQSQKTN